jgi:hypothetical protein
MWSKNNPGWTRFDDCWSSFVVGYVLTWTILSTWWT